MEPTGRREVYSNLYIFGFATAMVLIVATLLSFVAEELRPLQERNVEVEKKMGILMSVDLAKGVQDADNKISFIEDRYKEYISNSIVVNSEGEILEDRDAFEITQNIKEQIDKPGEDRALPVFIFTDAQGKTKYVIPTYGKGLWGPIWGYVALDSDFNTIYGALFDHAKETPGLGAEISEPWFQIKFKGKQLFNEEGEFVSVNLVKGGVAEGDLHEVDVISGGTITSEGLEAMLFDTFEPYVTYFKKQRKEGGQE